MKAQVYYLPGIEDKKKEIEELHEKIGTLTDELNALMKQTMLICENGHAHKMYEVVGTNHEYYVDNVYTGYYATSEYSATCPSCFGQIREYECPELKQLRQFYGHVITKKKD